MRIPSTNMKPSEGASADLPPQSESSPVEIGSQNQVQKRNICDKEIETRTVEPQMGSSCWKALTETSTCSEGSTTLSSQDNDDDDDDDDDDEEMVIGGWQSTTDVDDEEHGQICVPCAGQATDRAHRWVSNQCTICLSPFELNDQITRAGNPACMHVFHFSCIAHWLSAAGRKHVARQERRGDPTLLTITDPQQAVKQFPMLCPCCRQAFVWNESDQEEQEEQRQDTNNQLDAPILHNSTDDTPQIDISIHRSDENVPVADAV